MIESTQLWQGSFPEAYEDDVANWIKENSQQGQVYTIDCAERNWRPTSANDELLDLSLSGDVFSETDIFLGEGKTVLLKNAQEWDRYIEYSKGRMSTKVSMEVWQLVDALTTAAAIGDNFRIGMIYRGAAPNDEVSNFLVNGEADYNNYSLSYTEESKIAEWIVMWLNLRGYTINKKESTKIAQHLGTEIEMVPAMIKALRNYIHKNLPDEPVTYEGMLKELGNLGSISIWKLIDTIEAGDLNKTREVVQRLVLADGGIRVWSVLQNRVKGMIQVHGDSSHVPMKMKPASASYLRKSASLLGMTRLSECMIMCVDTERRLKGGSSSYVSGGSPIGSEGTDMLEVQLLAGFICNAFAQAKKKKKGFKR